MRESRVEVRGLKLCLCEWGTAEGVPIVCLHGFLDQGASWDGVARLLAEGGCHVVAPDARGHGKSDHVGAGGYYHFSDYLVDLDGLMRKRFREPVVLVGHSMGGGVASLYAGLRPERVAGLVVVEGLGPPAVDDEAAAEQLVSHLDQLAEPPRHGLLADLDEAVERMRRAVPEMSEELARRLAERVTIEVAGGRRWRWDALHRTRAAVAFDRDRFVAVLQRIEAPVTLVYGERSPFTVEDLAAREAAIRNKRRVVLPSRHNPHIECPSKLAEVIREAVDHG